MASVLGMLIFIGVLFTCVIPLFLYVNKVNSYYDTAATEMRQLDQEREMEGLGVYAHPVDPDGQGISQLEVYVKSKCALKVRVFRVWVNDTCYDQEDLEDLPLLLSGVSEDTIGGIEIAANGYFDVWVITDRGNLFASLTNTIHVIDASTWEASTYNFGIHIFITGGGTYTVTVTDDVGSPPITKEIQSAPNAYRIIRVSKPGTYHVTVEKSEGGISWGPFDCYVSWTYPQAQIEIPPS